MGKHTIRLNFDEDPALDTREYYCPNCENILTTDSSGANCDECGFSAEPDFNEPDNDPDYHGPYPAR